jgi:hypothetical protein
MEYLFNYEATQEVPPFALSEQNSSQHLSITSPTASLSPLSSPQESQTSFTKKEFLIESHQSPSPAVPGLIESVMTDDSSAGTCDSEEIPHYLEASSTILGSSLSTVPLNSDSLNLLSSRHVDQNLGNSATLPSSESSAPGFSQLMQAADDGNSNLGQSRMTVVPEDEVLDSFAELNYEGTLISAPTDVPEDQVLSQNPETNYWFFNLLSAARRSSRSPSYDHHLSTLGSSSRLNTPLLSLSPCVESINNAKSTVRSIFEDHESFEVSMKIDPPCTVEDVMGIIGNPAQLKMWCDPIETLVVVNSSDTGVSGQLETDREYEGEWIEATTTALETPPCRVGYMYQIGNMLLETIGLGSYGRITMFVERSRGKVTLTVGPFVGGIHASHTISVFEEGGQVRVIDRVRLDQREEDFSMARSVLGPCLSSCLLPHLGDYMDQVKTSMARLQILVEIGKLSNNIIIGAPRSW